ncbi:MAG: hypothetical protein M3069_28060 [Chloroflexota bacterium]|nr:hypothetical protein [Chloroflexota bacterium]
MPTLQTAVRPLNGDMVLGEIENQIRALRLTGREPLTLELGDNPYAAMLARANRELPALTIDYDPSVNVTDLPIRRVGPGTSFVC